MKKALSSLFALVICAGAGFAQEDVRPKLVSGGSFTMPASAVDAGIDGNVVVGVRVDDKGSVSNAGIISGLVWPCGTAPEKELKELTSTLVETMKALKFTPGTKKGKPSTMDIAMTIKLKNPKLEPVANEAGKPAVAVINGGQLNGKVTSGVKVRYPEEAKASGEKGKVEVQVLVDEDGKVVRAGAVKGPMVFHHATRDAACGTKFSPTLMEGRPVKVIGTLDYDFSKGSQ